MIEASPQGGFQMGFRVPLIVVSAYTPAGFISNTTEDFGSVVRFIERNFGIMEGTLTFADARGGASDLTEFFSLGNSPRTFQPIKRSVVGATLLDDETIRRSRLTTIERGLILAVRHFLEKGDLPRRLDLPLAASYSCASRISAWPAA